MQRTTPSPEDVLFSVHRSSRSPKRFVGLVVLGAMIFAPKIVGIIKRVWPSAPTDDLYEAAYSFTLLGVIGLLGVLPSMLRNRVDELIIDRSGIRYRGQSFTWEDIKWIGPLPIPGGGMRIAIKTTINPDVAIPLRLGRPLSFARFEEVMQRVREWTVFHAPQVTVEVTTPPKTWRAARWRGGINIAIGLGVPALLFSTHAFAGYRHQVAMRLFIVATGLPFLCAGVQSLRGK
ncbi:MAG TPA: hypothetical protein VL282_07470 [Tepidisphaeraceae bacterium]|jgi:hypothetical protein|nr:hypothetical protein [Tepidisphaeraceae bacterium]